MEGFRPPRGTLYVACGQHIEGSHVGIEWSGSHFQHRQSSHSTPGAALDARPPEWVQPGTVLPLPGSNSNGRVDSKQLIIPQISVPIRPEKRHRRDFYPCEKRVNLSCGERNPKSNPNIPTRPSDKGGNAVAYCVAALKHGSGACKWH